MYGCAVRMTYEPRISGWLFYLDEKSAEDNQREEASLEAVFEATFQHL